MSKQSNTSNFEGNTNREGEGSLYDKIMRENLLELFVPLIIEEMQLELKSVNPLPDKQPTTVIRETDAFLLIETYSEIEPTFILHIEFESKDDEEMIYRISEHHGIELRKFRLPIKHVVVYLGENEPKMRTTLNENEVFTRFMLVNAHDFSPKKWLAHEEPSKIIMAVLGDYQKQNAEIILESIVSKLRRVCKSNTQLKKFIEQLIIISRMRNLEELTIKVSKAMPITIDIEKDYLYNLGLKKAAEKIKAAEEEAKLEAEKAKLEAEKAKLEAEKAKLEAEKVQVAKAQVEQLAKENAELEAKINAELKAKAKARAEKKMAIKKMKATKRFTNEEIMEFLNLNIETFKAFVKEIETDELEEEAKEKND